MLSTYANNGSSLILFAGTSVFIPSITSTSSDTFTSPKSLSAPLFPRPSLSIISATWSSIVASAPFTAFTISDMVGLSNFASTQSSTSNIVISNTLLKIIGRALPLFSQASAPRSIVLIARFATSPKRISCTISFNLVVFLSKT